MLTSTVRIKGERDSWWDDVRRLLSGRGIRRGDPESFAVDESLKTLKASLETSAPVIGLTISHDGAGAKRAVTVVAFANQTHPNQDDEKPGEKDPAECMASQTLHHQASSRGNLEDTLLPRQLSDGQGHDLPEGEHRRDHQDACEITGHLVDLDPVPEIPEQRRDGEQQHDDDS